jgi:hypothetical protein
MYVNAKLKPIDTISGMAGGRINEMGGGKSSSMIYLIHCKNFVNVTMYPHPAHTHIHTHTQITQKIRSVGKGAEKISTL